MRLVIAEKPSVAKVIQSAVGDSYFVIALKGHILENANPDAYLSSEVPLNSKGTKVWRAEDLPIHPSQWLLTVSDEHSEIYEKINRLLGFATEVIHAGDPDREGQLIVDEVLDELGYLGLVTRVLLKSLSPEAIREAFDNRRPNSDYRLLSNAALARSHADWRFGINLSRAYSVVQNRNISIGRVKTPLLGMIVERDREIEAFVSSTYYDVYLKTRHSLGETYLKWVPGKEDAGTDDEGRLIDLEQARSIQKAALGTGFITGYQDELETIERPLPFNLSQLQIQACEKFGMTAKQVMDACQSLYVAGVITYPRTNCRYVPRQDREGLKEALSQHGKGVITTMPASVHAAFDDTKITAHSAILPTRVSPLNLTGDAALIYELIRESAVALFMQPVECHNISATITINGNPHVIHSSRFIQPGWNVIPAEGEFADMPLFKAGGAIEFNEVIIETRHTQPPQHYTDGTLIDAMVNVGKRVNHPELRAVLENSDGLGTDATRTATIESLLKKFIRRQGKYLVSTDIGRRLIDSIPAELCDPVMTAEWEAKLAKIVEGSLIIDDFEDEIKEFVTQQVSLALQS